MQFCFCMFLSVAHAEVARPQSSSKLLRERGPHGYILLPHVSPAGVDMENIRQAARNVFLRRATRRWKGGETGFSVQERLHRIQVCLIERPE